MGGGRSNKLSAASPRHASSTPGPPPPTPPPSATSTAAPRQASGPRINGASPSPSRRLSCADSRPEAPTPGPVFLRVGGQPGLCLIDWIRAVGASSSRYFLPVSSAAGQLGPSVGLRGLAHQFRAATVALVRFNTAATATSLYLLDWIHRCLSPARSRPNSGNFVWYTSVQSSPAQDFCYLRSKSFTDSWIGFLGARSRFLFRIWCSSMFCSTQVLHLQ